MLLAVPMPRSRPTRTAIPRSRPLLVLTAPPPCGKKATRPEQEDQKARQQLDEMSLNANDEQNNFFPPLFLRFSLGLAGNRPNIEILGFLEIAAGHPPGQ